ncbi:MAG TPA: glycosyltransferase [Stellaceae bacterium]
MTETGRGTAVSLTPVALDEDSRAFRIAGTLAEAGFCSLVVEGRASRTRFWGERLNVRSPGRRGAPQHPSAALPEGMLRDAVGALRAGRLGPLGRAALYAGYRGYDWRRHCAAPRRLAPPAQLYYLHSFEMHRAVVRLARRTGAPIVYDAHDYYRGIEPADARTGFDRDRLRPFLNRLEARLVAAADAVVTVSDGVAELMRDTFGRRPVVIRNCHDARADRMGGADLRTRLRLDAADRLAVVVGNCKPGMAVATAAAALLRLPAQFHLAFVGRGYEAVRATLPAELLGRRLHIGLALPPDEIVPAIRSADIGLVIYEPRSENYRAALPNGFFQVVAAGLPLVRRALPEIEAAIGGRAIGIAIERLEPEALAHAMLDCIAGADGFRADAAALAAELSWAGEARRLRRLIDALTGGRMCPTAAGTNEG